ncbi:MAG TPA: S1 RNA-binding domain-containing protein, partial [Usitatibacter sp.]
SVGDEVTAKILKFDAEKNRVSLGLKQLGEDPWIGISRRYPQGTRLFGKVTNITDYGAFVEIESGIEGLVHVSEMDWTNKNVHPAKVVSLGDEVETVVLSIDVERERISLGIKQLDGDPFGNYVTTHDKGNVVRGVVKQIDPKGALIELEKDDEGYLRASEIARDRVEDVRTHLKEGDEVEAVIINIDRKSRSINLSIKQKDAAEEQAALQKHTSESSASAGTTNLGALLKAKLSGSKDKE